MRKVYCNVDDSTVILIIVHIHEMKRRLELESNPSYSILQSSDTCMSYTDYENIIM